MGILDKFAKWSEKRLRLSQIKILYQNQAAARFVYEEIAAGITMQISEAIPMKQELEYFRLLTDNAIVELTYRSVLQDQDSTTMLQFNRSLRASYSGLAQGKQALKAMMSDVAGENTPFEKRFMPAVGWDNFGENEWSKMVSQATEKPN